MLRLPLRPDMLVNDQHKHNRHATSVNTINEKRGWHQQTGTVVYELQGGLMFTLTEI